MIVHHQKVLVNVLLGNNLTKRDAFKQAIAMTQGAARHRKLEKAWKQLREEGRVICTPSKRYTMST